MLQGVIANLTRAQRAHVGKALVTASSVVRRDGQGLVYNAVYFTPADWVFVLCASKGVERVELLRRAVRLMRGAMAFYGKGRCMVIVDRDGESYEVALSRPNILLNMADHALGDELFGRLRHTDTVLQVP
jgi:hypothetical protein